MLMSFSMTDLAGQRLPSQLQLSVARAVSHKTAAPIQWTTLAWIAGAALAATIAIAVIVLVSRRPKSMEDGIEEFSRSLQAVAPVHRLPARQSAEHNLDQRPAPPRPGTVPGIATEERTVRTRRGETETV